MILIASKSQETLETLSFALELEGKEVKTASSEFDVIMNLGEAEFFILDTETLSAGIVCVVRAQSRMPILALSRRDQTDQVFAEGATDNFTKPFSPERVVARILEML